MLVTFRSPAHGDIVMLEDHARHLIRLMGHSDTMPGAIDAEAVPRAREQLSRELALLDADSDEEAAERDDDNDDDAPVEWQRRAWPLLQMLEAAATDGEYIQWY